MMLVPAQVAVASRTAKIAAKDRRRMPRRRKTTKGKEKEEVGATSAADKAEQVRYGRPGGNPNVAWLHVPESDLRSHPRYVPLAPPRCVGALTCWAIFSPKRR